MQQGNDAAFRELYQRTAPALLKHARQFLHNEAVCKDLLQDIYVGLYTKRNKLPSNLNVAGYLRTAIKYQVSNALRNELSRGVHHQEILRNSRLTEEHIYRAETKEFQQTIWKKIQALPEKCREAFVLNRFDQQNHQSISRQMGISVKTVEKHISKAIRLLQRELGQNARNANS